MTNTLARKSLRNGELVTLEQTARGSFVVVWQTPAQRGKKANILDLLTFPTLEKAQARFDRVRS